MYNYIDFIIVGIILLYLVSSWPRNFWSLIADILAFFASFFLALQYYSQVATFILANFSLGSNLARALGFLAVLIFARAILGMIAALLISLMPNFLKNFKFNHLFAIVPAFVDALIFISILIMVIMSMPMTPILKRDITESRIGNQILLETMGAEQRFKEIFGGAFEEALNFVTIKPQSDETISLHFKTGNVSIDRNAEQQMFNLVNQERIKNGLQELIWNEKLAEVARSHSKDMFEKGYFSHYSPEGKDVGDRLSVFGVNFIFAGENLAYAPSVGIAHQGLMNSPGHRANILKPEFHQVGIGVYDGGIYGKMFTQVFKD